MLLNRTIVCSSEYLQKRYRKGTEHLQCCTYIWMLWCGFEGAHAMDALLRMMHYADVLVYASQCWPQPHRMSLTTPALEAWESSTFLSNSIPTCSSFAHTGMSVKVAKEGDAALRTAAGADSFSPQMSHLSPPLSVSLFLPFYVSSPSPFLASLAPGQRKALTPRLQPGLHCQLFFIFHSRGGGCREQES